MQVQVNKSHYNFTEYVSKARWASYWHQLDEVVFLSPKTILEIGTGAGIFKQFAGCFGFSVKTADIDSELSPDFVASVLNLPLNDNSFDIVVCFQVLEHLPFADFKRALQEIKRVAARYIILSLPDADAVWRYSFHIPRFGEKNVYIKRPRLRQQEHQFDGEHYWEISKKGYPLYRIVDEIETQGLCLIKTYRVPENMYHRFFVIAVEK